MYIDKANSYQHGKTYTRYLLRESYRDKGKVKHRTLANLTKVPHDVRELLKAALKGELVENNSVTNIENVGLHQGPSFGAVFVLATLCKRLKINDAIGKSPFLKQIIWLIIARIIDQGSRLSASRLFNHHTVEQVLDLEDAAVHNLYRALDWAADHQEAIEKRLFKAAHQSQPPKLYLYDVTSSYLEGTDNELADWGYNRDKKRGKMQIVIGLLTDDKGDPIAVRVFEGNTSDPKTCLDQIKLLAESFGVTEVTLVGDRGMIKSPQIKELNAYKFHFITAITKQQIESLIRKGVLQLDLFDDTLTEVRDSDIRYILRRNPLRAQETAASRQDKLAALQAKIEQSNIYLEEHRRARVEVQLRDLKAYAEKLKINSLINFVVAGRRIAAAWDCDRLAEVSRLDGCYAIKTDVAVDVADTAAIHDRYKDLAKVEKAFRTMKTACLEVRPVYVRNAQRTRGHVFLTMLAYKIVREMERLTPDRKDIPMGETIALLTQIQVMELSDEHRCLSRIPRPIDETMHILKQLDITLPAVIPTKGMAII